MAPAGIMWRRFLWGTDGQPNGLCISKAITFRLPGSMGGFNVSEVGQLHPEEVQLGLGFQHLQDSLFL